MRIRSPVIAASASACALAACCLICTVYPLRHISSMMSGISIHILKLVQKLIARAYQALHQRLAECAGPLKAESPAPSHGWQSIAAHPEKNRYMQPYERFERRGVRAIPAFDSPPGSPSAPGCRAGIGSVLAVICAGENRVLPRALQQRLHWEPKEKDWG